MNSFSWGDLYAGAIIERAISDSTRLAQDIVQLHNLVGGPAGRRDIGRHADTFGSDALVLALGLNESASESWKTSGRCPDRPGLSRHCKISNGSKEASW